MTKYARLHQRVEASGLVDAAGLRVPHAVSDEELGRAHNESYIRRVQRGELTAAELRRIGFPWSPQMVERSRRSAGATIEACRAALVEGIAVNLAGGTHHAFADCGEGYCIFNDSAIAARAMQAAHLARSVVIIDCDVHQGNGTASIFAQDPSVFTFSIHSARNFPLRKEVSDLDIGLADGTGDQEYLDALQPALVLALERSCPDLAIYLAGADPYSGDRFGRLAMTKQGVAERDRLVLDMCRQAGVPIAITMAGGYARVLDDLVDIHFETVRQAAERFGARARVVVPEIITHFDPKEE